MTEESPLPPPLPDRMIGRAFGEWNKRGIAVDEISRIVKELRAAFAGHRAPVVEPDFPRLSAALDVLFLTNRIDALHHAARHLQEALPHFQFARNICEVLDNVPPMTDQLPFRDDITKAVQVVKRDGADTVLLLFCDRLHCLGLPLNLIHRWLGKLPFSLVYLRDLRRKYFTQGISTLGPDYAGTIAALRDLVASLGGRRVLVHCGSGGVFGSLVYSLDLHGEAILAFGGATNLSVEFNGGTPRWGSAARELGEAPSGQALDSREVYLAAANPPRVRMLYAEGDVEDRRQAEWMAGLPNFEIEAYPGYGGHNIAIEMARRGELHTYLDWLVEVWRA